MGDVQPTELCLRAAALATDHDRADLADRLRVAAGRIDRPGAVVVVIGEFKQGKSSLVNGLVGTSVCPVDDDLATSALTVVYESAQVEVFVHRRLDGEVKTFKIEAEQLASVVTEQGNPDNELAVERVDVGLPSPLLASGITIIDSPGVGGLGAGHTAATLAFLPLADALLFVSDATSELSGPELAFLAMAVDRCPNVIVCETKTDIAPSWRRIVAIDEGHLARRGIDATVVAVSSSTRLLALHRGDRELNDESGFPVLLGVLQEAVLGRARATAVQRSLDEGADATAQLRTVDLAELAALDDPTELERVLADAKEATARLDALKAVGSRWNQVLNEQLTELSNEVSFRFRESQRLVTQRADEELDAATSGWDEVARRVQTEVAESVAGVYEHLAAGLRTTGDAVAEVLAAELDLPLLDVVAASPIDTDWGEALAGGTGLKQTAATGVGQAVGALRGMQSGLMLIGMLGMFAPALAIATPVMIGLGSAFGVKALADQRKRKATEARQAARVKIRRFLDDVTFRVGNDVAQSARRAQNQLRDVVSARVAELQRTVAESASQASATAELSAAQRGARRDELTARLRDLDELSRAIDAARA